jgi:hypothetical protein
MNFVFFETYVFERVWPPLQLWSKTAVLQGFKLHFQLDLKKTRFFTLDKERPTLKLSGSKQNTCQDQNSSILAYQTPFQNRCPWTRVASPSYAKVHTGWATREASRALGGVGRPTFWATFVRRWSSSNEPMHHHQRVFEKRGPKKNNKKHLLPSKITLQTTMTPTNLPKQTP